MYTESSGPGQPSPEHPTDVPIMVSTPPINGTFPCCPGCEVLNKPVTELVPIEEDHPIALPQDNQGWATRMAMVHLVNMLIMEVDLIVKGMVVWLVCNHPQPQDMSIQTNTLKSRVVSGDLTSSDSLERRLVTRDPQAIPLMPRSSGSGWATREMGAAFTMGGVLYLPWLVGSLEERPGEGYWLSFVRT